MSNYCITGVPSAVSQIHEGKDFDNVSSRRVARALRGIAFFSHKNVRSRYYLKLKRNVPSSCGLSGRERRAEGQGAAPRQR